MTVSNLIYLDYAASTPLDPRVVQAMSQALTDPEGFGNPASATHLFGQRARAQLVQARQQVAQLLQAQPEEIVFTSGATEACNLAVLGAARANADRGRHIVTSRTEHKAVLDACKQLEREGFTVTYLTPDSNGVIAPSQVAEALRADSVLVALMYVNNEIGVIQDIQAVAQLCHERQVLLFCDAVQAAGRLEINVQELAVDFLAISAHKIYGPKGIGALYVRKSSRGALQAISHGGGQEDGLRAGTVATHQALGFGLACELVQHSLSQEYQRITALRDQLWNGLAQLPGVSLNAATAPRVPHILNITVDGVHGESLLAAVATELALSNGAACDSARGEPSFVLRSLGLDTQRVQSSLRISLGRGTHVEDIEQALVTLRREVLRLRELSPTTEANDLTDSDVIRGVAGSMADDAWVRFILKIEGEQVIDARFQAYGCPHTLAIATWLTDELKGRTRQALVPDGPIIWAQRWEVPAEKLGRLLIIEDALHDCMNQWTFA
jgi:cysteine desulfurase